jgi:hypothetical protein
MDREAAAALELSRRRAGQALGAVRKASRLLAASADGYDSFGSCEVRSQDDVAAAAELIALALSERGQVDVVLLVSTTS